MSTSPTVLSGTTAEPLGPDKILKLFVSITEVLEEFEERLQVESSSYTLAWWRFVAHAQLDLTKKGSGWIDTVKHLHGNPTNWHDYVAEVLKIVPPAYPVLKLQITRTQQLNLLRHNITDSVYDEQMACHLPFASNIDDKSKASDHGSLPSDSKATRKTQRDNNIPDLTSKLDIMMDGMQSKTDGMQSNIDIPAILEAPTPVICRFAKSLTLKETDPSTETKNEEAYHDPKGPADDDPQEPTLPSEEAYPCGDDDERKTLLAEGFLDDEIDQLFEEDEMNAHLEERTHSSDFNDDPDKTYDGAYYDSAYHDGFKNGIAELAYDDGYSTGYNDGSYEPNYHNDSASDYYSDSSYDDGYYSEAPD